MIRQAPRLLLRSLLPHRALQTHRLLSTAPPAQKSRSWKSSAARWTLAIGATYYYTTSDLFAEEPPFPIPPPQAPTEETPIQTLESLSPSAKRPSSQQQPPSPPSPDPSSSPLSPTNEGLAATSEEASQEGAFNEATGEINWDCPCLGGMAHGPCGEQFRAAFSCFVYSKEEPKGMECIPNFKTMQDCFRAHPDIYGAELAEDEEREGAVGEVGEGEVGAAGPEVGEVAATPAIASSVPEATSSPSVATDGSAKALPIKAPTENTQAADTASNSDDLVPKAAHDATDANTEK